MENIHTDVRGGRIKVVNNVLPQRNSSFGQWKF